MTPYRVKVVRSAVRRVTFLWGGSGVDVSLASDLTLTFRVPDEGEAIVFGVIKSNPRREIRLGQLEIGEAFTVPLRDITGVYAHTVIDTHDTYVDCYVAYGNKVETPTRLRGVPGL
jgi:hypothetical protein